MAETLTKQQQMAVVDRGGDLLVSAAAGSGKTKVLVDRLLGYLTDPVNPANMDDFLIITYTKAAASELRGKIAAKLTQRIAEDPENRHLQKQLQRLYLTEISTVHGFCSDLLREHAYKLDLSADFRVADENECRELREQVMTDILDRVYSTEMNNPDFLAFIDTQGYGRNDRRVPDLIMKVYDSARCHLSPEAWLADSLANISNTSWQDVSETVWGQSLISDLFDYLDAQIEVLRQLADEADAYVELNKPVINLRSTIDQLVSLRSCSTWDEIIAAKQIQHGVLRFPKNNPDPDLSERIKTARNICKEVLEKKLDVFADTSSQIASDLEQCASAARGLIAVVTLFDAEYQRLKRSRRVLDFGDLEHKTLDLLRGKRRGGITAAAAEIGRRFREVMVDEYQDSNAVQDAIFSAITAERHNCFMVGDVKQSIYSFRLADPGIFLDKYNRYVPSEEEEDGEGRKILLSHNFRSGGEVIEAVNDVFTACMSPSVGGMDYGEAEMLREGVPHMPLPDPAVELYALETEEDANPEEAQFVARRIRDMIRDGTLIRQGENFRPVTAEDIVILLRSPNSQAKDYQRALEAEGVRCNTGAGFDLLETEEIGTLRSILQTISNPQQDIPLISALASPVFGFGADDLAAIRGKNKRISFFDSLRASSLPKAEKFVRLLQQLREEASRSSLSILLRKCFSLTRIDSIYAAMPGGEIRQANLRTFFQQASEYEKANSRGLEQFLKYLDAMEGSGLMVGNANCEGVTIMSIHKSKGLEFPVVFLCGLARKFNTENLRQQILCDRELGFGLSLTDNVKRIRYGTALRGAISAKLAAQGVSEELRVLYVAMTRARDRLIMTYAACKLEKQMTELLQRMSFDTNHLLAREAGCPGDWIMMAAMSHMEAHELHALAGGKPECKMPDAPWLIHVIHTNAAEIMQSSLSAEIRTVPSGAEERLRSALNFHYQHVAATRMPSKQTATGRKGRLKDAEAAENTMEKRVYRAWRSPSFLTRQTDGRAYGNAMHAAMQFISYENCSDESSVRAELDRLLECGFLSQEQRDMTSTEQIAAFFRTPLGEKLVKGVECIREFKFSVLDDGEKYCTGMAGEQVLLQGVVDCALIEEDGITIIDFKTDRVTQETIAGVAERYIPQIDAYADAICRVYEKPVKKKYLYFFRMHQLMKI